MTLAAGTRLGRYEILDLLGVGGMGEVYSARDTRIGRRVAIKLLPASLAADPDRLRRFEQEARTTGLLNHPNILTLYDIGSVADEDVSLRGRQHSPYIVSELLVGRTLRQELAGHRLPESQALGYAIQIVNGLAAAHGKGIVHRDLKPENLFITTEGVVKILDFGVAKLTNPEPLLSSDETVAADTAAGVMVGTPGYMSPEQVRAGSIDQRSDVFSFGAILYEMVSGRRAFHRGTSIETFSAILHDDPAPISESAIAPGLAHIVARCLEKNPEQRFPSAAELGIALGVHAATSSSRAETGMRAPAGRRTRPWMAVAAGAAVLVGVLGWTIWRPPGLRSRSSAPPSAPRVTPFLASEAIEKQPAWSPKGDLIAYVSDEAGNDDIWICDPSGANPINLTASFAGADAHPAWSPDGQRIAFYSARDGGGIFSMTALGAGVRKIAPLKPGILYTFSLTWSRRGSIVFTDFDDAGLKQVYRVPSSMAEAECLTCRLAGLAGAQGGDLSPSGELLAFKTQEHGPQGDLYVVHIASGRLQLVANQVAAPRWSPDGDKLTFISARDGIPDLWQVAIGPTSGVRAGEIEPLTSGLNATAFTLSPDARQVLVVKEKSASSLWSFPAHLDLISDVAAGQRLTDGQFRDARARWAPDGREVLFQSDRRGSVDIWRLSASGAAPVRLTSGPGNERRPRLSRDGQWVALDVHDTKGEFVYLMRPDGSDLHIADPDWPAAYQQVCCADWSPDGSQLVVMLVSRQSGTLTGFVEIDRGTGRASRTTVVDLPGEAEEYHRWSPDGRFVVYEAVKDGAWHLWISDSQGRGARQLTAGVGNERQAAWRSLPLAVYFLKDLRDVWRIPIAESGEPTAEPRPWLVLTGRRRIDTDSLDFTRDGERALVTVVDLASDIWLVELGRR